MRTFITAAFAFVALAVLTTAANAQPVGTIFLNGDLVFTDVNDLVGLRINSSDASLVGGNATDLDGAATGNFGVVNDQAPNFIEWGNLLGMTFVESLAGNVFPAGLPNQAAVDTNYEFLYRTSADPQTDIVGVLQLVPEPTTLGIAGLGMIALVTRRRR